MAPIELPTKAQKPKWMIDHKSKVGVKVMNVMALILFAPWQW